MHIQNSLEIYENIALDFYMCFTVFSSLAEDGPSSFKDRPLLQKFTVIYMHFGSNYFITFCFKASADEEVTPDEPAATEFEAPTISSEVEAPENTMLVQEPVDLYQSEQVISKG